MCHPPFLAPRPSTSGSPDRRGGLRTGVVLFSDNSSACRYLWVYILVLKSFLVYVSDIFTAVTMLSTKTWTNQIFQNCTAVRGCVAIPFSVGQWLFVSCIIFSFLLVRNIPTISNLLNLMCLTDKACLRVAKSQEDYSKSGHIIRLYKYHGEQLLFSP
jgi:hypothetical protein